MTMAENRVSAVDKLTNALLECRSVRDLQTRQSIIDELRSDIRDKIQPSRGNREHVHHIVWLCWDFEDGILDLLERVRYYERDSIGMQHVLEVWHWIRGVYPRQKLEGLARILNNLELTEQELESFYLESLQNLPSWAPPYNVERILEHLGDILVQIQTQTYPLLDFILRIAASRAQTDTAAQILKWAHENIPIAHSEIDVSNIEKRWCEIQQSSTQLTTAQAPVLTIIIEPFAESDDGWLYQTEHFLWEDMNKVSRLADLSGGYPLETIQKNMSVVLDQVSLKLKSSYANLTIEFFLPCNLLDLNIENWNKETGGFRRSLGFRFPIVLRPLERIKSEDAWGLLESRWLLCQKMDDPANFVRLCKPDESPDALYDDLLAHKHITRLGLPFQPPIRQDVQSLLDAAIYSGIPIVLWYRKTGNQPEIEKNIHDFLAMCEWLELINQLHHSRQEFSLNQDHWAHHTALLLDNPKRVPPGMRAPKLTTPQQSERGTYEHLENLPGN